MKHLRRISGFCVCVVILLTSQVGADTITFFGYDPGTGTAPTPLVNSVAARNSFLTDLSGVGVDNLESYAVGSSPATYTFVGDGITAAATYTFVATTPAIQTATGGRFPTSGTKYLNMPRGGTGTSVNLVFNAPVSGFGMYVTDLGDPPFSLNNLVITLTFSDSTTASITTPFTRPGNPSGNVLFFGGVETNNTQTITQVTFNTTSGVNDVYAVDDLTVGVTSLVPEPATAGSVLVGIVLLLAASFLRRRFSLRC